ncbi:MAG: hypothetical protein P8J20_13360 [Novosphingobium sp.]|nr:hypothetical protein [Novosphingobium sp.]
MSDTKSFATLGPTLLARKGGAKPAMRPQLQPLQEFHESTAREMSEDLGWNDMGTDVVDGLTPQGEGAEVVSIAGDAKAPPQANGVPQVVRQQDELSEYIAAKPAPRRSAREQGRRAAFTLRLDSDRHLKLRLASTVLNRSAQDIVTEALDNQLAAMTDIDSLAAKIRQSR